MSDAILTSLVVAVIILAMIGFFAWIAYLMEKSERNDRHA